MQAKTHRSGVAELHGRCADPVEAAPVLLALADDNGLPALSVAAADFCVHHYAQVRS